MVYWIACYKNGSSIKQDESQNYDNLDRNNLEAFILMFEDKPVLTIWLDNKQLIWRLRREIKPGLGEIRVHLVGWREQVGGQVQQTLFYIFEQYDNEKETFPIIHVSGKFDRERNRFMNEPKFREFEVFPGEIYYLNRKVKRMMFDDNLGVEREVEETIQEPHIK